MKVFFIVVGAVLCVLSLLLTIVNPLALLGVAFGVTVGRCRSLNLNVDKLATVGLEFAYQLSDGGCVDGIVSQFCLSYGKRELHVSGCLV